MGSPNRLNKVQNTTRMQGNESKTNNNIDLFSDKKEKAKGPIWSHLIQKLFQLKKMFKKRVSKMLIFPT